jgi:hypothetical protein
MCVSFEVQTSSAYNKVKLSRNRAWWPIGVFPVRYKGHLRVESEAVSVSSRGCL